MEKTTTDSISIVTDAVEPSPTAQPQEESAVHNPCPVCGFGTHPHDRFCRRCGINLEFWRSVTTGSLYGTSTTRQEKIENLIPEQKMNRGSIVSEGVNPTSRWSRSKPSLRMTDRPSAEENLGSEPNRTRHAGRANYE